MISPLHHVHRMSFLAFLGMICQFSYNFTPQNCNCPFQCFVCIVVQGFHKHSFYNLVLIPHQEVNFDWTPQKPQHWNRVIRFGVLCFCVLSFTRLATTCERVRRNSVIVKISNAICHSLHAVFLHERTRIKVMHVARLLE